MGGRRVTNTDVYETLLSTPVSRTHAQRARALRIVGFTLIAGGVVSTVGAGAGIAAQGHPEDGPAGLSLLGVSGLGAVLTYLGTREELKAVGSYNQFAFETGACAAPL
jgi:ABC-type Na+ efflux pump permease subunit